MEKEHPISLRPCHDTCSGMAKFDSSVAARCYKVSFVSVQWYCETICTSSKQVDPQVVLHVVLKSNIFHLQKFIRCLSVPLLYLKLISCYEFLDETQRVSGSWKP